jgi:mRNA interferase MazF
MENDKKQTRKPFDEWNEVKKKVNKRAPSDLKERQILFVSIGVNVGYEEDGKGDKGLRPVLVFKKFGRELFWGIPLTSKNREGEHYFNFTYKDDQSSCALLSQMRAYSARRIEYRSGYMKQEDWIKLCIKMTSYIMPTTFTPPPCGEGESRRNM